MGAGILHFGYERETTLRELWLLQKIRVDGHRVYGRIVSVTIFVVAVAYFEELSTDVQLLVKGSLGYGIVIAKAWKRSDHGCLLSASCDVWFTYQQYSKGGKNAVLPKRYL